MTPAEPALTGLTPPRGHGRLPAALSTARGKVGMVMLLVVLACAFVGPLIAPHAIDVPIGVPGTAPGSGAPLGTDFLGRDVLSRFLNGGSPLILTTLASIVLTYTVGVTLGIYAALASKGVDGLILRATDIFLTFPPLLVLLVLVAGAGRGATVLVIGITLVLIPGVIRIVRTMALEVANTGFVEAAIARGETTAAILRREVLPNIVPGLIADAGSRMLGAIFLTASMSFLGLAAEPPAANWALMIAENQSILSTNVWSVLAPACAIAALTVSVNLLGDAYVHARTSSKGR